MTEYKALTEFYPTPPELIARMLNGTDLNEVKTILEPSAGKGDIALFVALAMYRIANDNYLWRRYYVKENLTKEETQKKIIEDMMTHDLNDPDHYHLKYLEDIDCIELDPTLRTILQSKECRVVDDDFLKFSGEKHYDLIIMNPPFSNGDEHLIHALDIAERTGSRIVCLLNAETIRNPYTNLRKELLKRLENLGADYEYVQDAFKKSERKTDVEIVIVRVDVPSPFARRSRIWEELDEAQEEEFEAPENVQELVTGDVCRQAVQMYKKELEAGRRLIAEYLALKPYLTSSFETEETPSYQKGCTLILQTDSKHGGLDWNDFVASVRYKYWYELLHKPVFLGNLTSNVRDEYFSDIKEFAKREFSLSNIYKVKIEILKRTAQGIEDKIVDIFEELSYKNSMESQGNIHLFSGWKSNSAFRINPKVVVPWMGCWDSAFNKFRYETYSYNRNLFSLLSDIEKCLDFLDGGENDNDRDIATWLRHYESEQQTKKLHFKYFDIDVFKKGTVHIRFTDLNALKKLNIYGCLHKGWLPPTYGKKAYSAMDEESRAVVDGFEGEDSYVETFAEPSRWIIAPEKNILMIGA